MTVLRALQRRYSSPPPYGYAPDTRDRRGRERAKHLLAALPGTHLDTFLELGCSDGMVGRHLQALGKSAFGIDNRASSFDERAINAGVGLIQADAEDLSFDDAAFDVALSYNSFEHFADPAQVLSEIYRVVRSQGYIYLEFGPLYMSPMGLHAYQKITVPYCQLLFSRDTLSDFLSEEQLDPLNFDHCNGWSLVRFRELWKSFSDRLETVSYIEVPDYHHLDLIERYAPVLRAATDQIDDLTCASIEVLFRKK